MPATSQAQYRAMQAAAHGSGTLGIPRDVGEEFAAATLAPGKLPKRAKKYPTQAVANAIRGGK